MRRTQDAHSLRDALASQRRGPETVEPFVDYDGNDTPAFAPGHAYLGNLRRGRVCYDHRGTKLKVLERGMGSVTVRYSGGAKRVIRGRAFTAPHKPTTLARGTVVQVNSR